MNKLMCVYIIVILDLLDHGLCIPLYARNYTYELM